jgi:hypothetical protein
MQLGNKPKGESNMSQTSFSVNSASYMFEGQLADSGENDVVTALAEEAIPFGKFMVRGTDPAVQGKLPTTATGITSKLNHMGVALHDQAREGVSGTGTYAIKDAVSALKRGRMVVKVEEAVVAGDDVYVRYAAGGLGLGSFRTSDPGSAAALLANAVYMSAASANGFAVVEFNL